MKRADIKNKLRERINNKCEDAKLCLAALEEIERLNNLIYRIQAAYHGNNDGKAELEAILG